MSTIYDEEWWLDLPLRGQWSDKSVVEEKGGQDR